MNKREAEEIVASQLSLYGRIARSYENFRKRGTANITPGLVEARLHSLEANWAKFEAQNDRLLLNRETIVEVDYRERGVPDSAEEAYIEQRGLFLEELASLNKPSVASASTSDTETSRSPRTTLPRIQLPEFTGKYEEWPPFRDLFQSIIGKDASISAVEKLHYLKTCLKGEAAQMIRNLPSTAENFGRAWLTLVKFYENKRLLVRSFLGKFVAFPQLKGESANDLRKLYHCVGDTVSSLEGIGRPVIRSEDLFVHMIGERLDSCSRREWENSLKGATEPPSLIQIQDFLDERLHLLESLQPEAVESTLSKPSSSPRPKARALHARQEERKTGRCAACPREHFLWRCDVYTGKTSAERKKLVESAKLCLNCLGRHKIGECPSQKTCFSCGERHHTSLHEAYSAGEARKNLHVAHRTNSQSKAILLATARVRVADSFGGNHVVRALIDQGSETSLVSESLVQRLRLPRARASVSVYGIGGRLTGVARGRVDLSIESGSGHSTMRVSALILPRLTQYDGGIRADRRKWKHLNGIELADPKFLASDPVEMLLGAEVYAGILQPGLLRGGPQEPVAQRTTLGWILSGAVRGRGAPASVGAHHCGVEDELTGLVQQFWRQEEQPAVAALTGEEQECEAFFARTVKRAADGRYCARLPLRSTLPDLSGTLQTAIRALSQVERKFSKDADFQQLYRDFMRQYDQLGHMTAAPEASAGDDRVCFLPHHGVRRESSSTTKLRVVFNGSSAVASGDTLNGHLMVGANLLPALSDVLLRWRVHSVVMTSDIEKMYRQILVDPADRHLQQIVWRNDAKRSINRFQLNTVTYGLACAPFLAMRTLKQLAADEEVHYPKGAAVLLGDVYMDDILTGAASIEEARELREQLSGLCTAGGFPLRKWSANHSALLDDIPAEHRMQRDALCWHPQESHTTLGLRWHPSTDCFSYSTGAIAVPQITKRSVLSLTARLFDPLGWLTPAVVRAKIWFQSTWLKGLDWDSPLDEHEAHKWREFQAGLPELEEIRVPRRLPLDSPELELHGFSDASERAYAATIYVRAPSSMEPKTHEVRLITAKSKVAPLKQISLPRLELCAATLMARLMAHVRRTLNLTTAPVYMWSDSTVVLGWIRGHPSRWKTYVANRVSEIQTTVPEAQWRHVSGQDNPADCSSRGIAPGELINHPLWWRGPPWLRAAASEWPDNAEAPSSGDELPEERIRVHVAVAERPIIMDPEELTRFSTLNRLLRVTAWCRRWLRRRGAAGRPAAERVPACYGPVLMASEIENARLAWLRVVQAKNFEAEIRIVGNGEALQRKNVLTRLNPMVDVQGILRVGGRLKNAILSYDEKHPVILPKGSHFSRLVVEDSHRRTLHGGVQLTLGAVRQRYWIPGGRPLVKAFILRCVTCVRWRASAPQQLMGQLPRQRVTAARPFLHTGVDYAGPIRLRTAKGRGHRSYKAYIALFVCLSSRAVHLEVVSDYTTEAFLAALRRFVSRRGLCSSLHSDCGTNFVGADAQLRALFKASSAFQRDIAEKLAGDGIRWRFNTPAAPHFGGIWEAAVKSTKHHLRRVLGEHTLTYEEMSTLLAQIEACLNSRPLQALSDDPDDLAALTPGHFLIGAALNAVPEASAEHWPAKRLTRWQLLTSMRDHFWARWSREYLNSLQHLPKWWKADNNIRVGRLCLIRGDHTPPTCWPLARISELHPGPDGHVRVVTVRTAATEFRRPIVKLVLLPSCDANEAEE